MTWFWLLIGAGIAMLALGFYLILRNEHKRMSQWRSELEQEEAGLERWRGTLEQWCELTVAKLTDTLQETQTAHQAEHDQWQARDQALQDRLRAAEIHAIAQRQERRAAIEALVRDLGARGLSSRHIERTVFGYTGGHAWRYVQAHGNLDDKTNTERTTHETPNSN